MQFHISNLHSNIIESDLQRLFSRYGEVEDVQLIRDKCNNRSRGRGYVTMPVPREANQALVSLNGTVVQGKKIRIEQVEYDPAPQASWSRSRQM